MYCVASLFSRIFYSDFSSRVILPQRGKREKRNFYPSRNPESVFLCCSVPSAARPESCPLTPSTTTHRGSASLAATIRPKRRPSTCSLENSATRLKQSKPTTCLLLKSFSSSTTSFCHQGWKILESSSSFYFLCDLTYIQSLEEIYTRGRWIKCEVAWKL